MTWWIMKYPKPQLFDLIMTTLKSLHQGTFSFVVNTQHIKWLEEDFCLCVLMNLLP